VYFFSQLPKFGPFTSATWNYSESGQGKGAADGIGGSLKRIADRLVAQGQDIPDPQSLYNPLKGKTITELFYVTPSDITATEALLAGVLVKRVPSTMRLHQVVLSQPNHVETRHLSCSFVVLVLGVDTTSSMKTSVRWRHVCFYIISSRRRKRRYPFCQRPVQKKVSRQKNKNDKKVPSKKNHR